MQGLSAGEYVVLTVADTGCGISPEHARAGDGALLHHQGVGKGTGLGLSMVYGFAKQSGGAFHLRSRMGEGTRAEIWLPRAGDEEARSTGKAEKAAAAAAVRRLDILLVDDHEGVRETTAALLRDLGHDVVQAGDGPELLALLDGADGVACNLLISDYAMPHVSGAEVIRQARETRPDLPAILITGYADAQSISRRPEGVQILAKPFTPDQLASAIAAAVVDKAPAAAPLRARQPAIVQAAE